MSFAENSINCFRCNLLKIYKFDRLRDFHLILRRKNHAKILQSQSRGNSKKDYESEREFPAKSRKEGNSLKCTGKFFRDYFSPSRTIKMMLKESSFVLEQWREEKHFLYFHDKLLTIFLFLYQHGNLASSFRSCESFIFIIHSPEFPLTLLAEKLNGEVSLRGDSKWYYCCVELS